MLEFIKRARILFVASILAIAAFTYFVIYKLIQTRLEYSVLEDFMDLGFANRTAIEQAVDGYIQDAESFSNIKTIKNVVVNYKNGLVRPGDLRKHTVEAFKEIAGEYKNLVFVQRVVDGKAAAGYGNDRADWHTTPILPVAGESVRVNMMDWGGKIYAVVYSPIKDGEELLGADNVVFDIAPVAAALSKSNYTVNVLDDAGVTALKGSGTVVITGFDSMLYDCGGYYLFSGAVYQSGYLCVTAQKDFVFKGIRSISLTVLYLIALLFAGLLCALYFFLIKYANDVLHLTEKKREDFQDLAFRDALTGAYTRTFLNFWTKNMFEFDKTYCMVVIDIDNMKYINDTFGHAAGDNMLRSFCSLIRSFVRSGDIVARLGGDEFLIILENADEEAGRRIMQHVEADIDSSLKFDFKVSFSYGLAKADKRSGMKEAVKLADADMYRQKEARKQGGETGAPA